MRGKNIGVGLDFLGVVRYISRSLVRRPTSMARNVAGEDGHNIRDGGDDGFACLESGGSVAGGGRAFGVLEVRLQQPRGGAGVWGVSGEPVCDVQGVWYGEFAVALGLRGVRVVFSEFVWEAAEEAGDEPAGAVGFLGVGGTWDCLLRGAGHSPRVPSGWRRLAADRARACPVAAVGAAFPVWNLRPAPI